MSPGVIAILERLMVGYMKPSDAARLDNELQQSIRDFYEITSSLFRRFHACQARQGRGDRYGNEV